MYWSPNFLAVVSKKQEISRPREPTNKHSSHQNAGSSIWVFKNFLGVIPPDPHLPHPTPSPALGQALRPGVGPKLGPLNFSAVVAPLAKSFLLQYIWTLAKCHGFREVPSAGVKSHLNTTAMTDYKNLHQWKN